ncbi:MAG: META domain-containing protein [Glycocaulis sp.]
MRALLLFSCLASAGALLGACSGADEAASGQTAAPAEAAQAQVTLALTFRERIALGPEAIAEAQLIALGTSADSPALVAQVSESLSGRQVPVDLTLSYDPSDVPASSQLAVTGRILDRTDGRVWVTAQEAVFAAGNRLSDLGMIMLERAGHGSEAGRAYTCEDGSTLTVSYAGPDITLLRGAETYHLPPVIAASGARFETGEPGADGHVLFWSRGAQALFASAGSEPVSCEAASEPEPAPEPAPHTGEEYLARGNEPGWLLRLSGDTAEYLGNYGDTRLAGQVVSREALEEDRTRLIIETPEGDRLVAEISAQRCQDSMAGLTYPDTVRVMHGDEAYSGCGGDAESLLTGGAWTVTHIAGAQVPGERAVTMEFDGEGHVAGQAPCNRYSASYQMTGEGLIISQAVSTRMACENAIMALESTFFEIFQGSLPASIDEDGVLSLGEGRILAARE